MEDENIFGKFQFIQQSINQNITTKFHEHGSIKVHFPNMKKKIVFPLSHVFLLPNEDSEKIMSQIDKIEHITLYFPKYEDFIYDYYKSKKYEDINKYKEDSIKIWKIFNQYTIFNDMEECISSYEKKIQNGNFKPELDFIKEQLTNDEPMNQEVKEHIKKMEFKSYKIIMEKLPDDLKKKWLLTFDHKDRIKVLGLINFEELNQEDVKQILEEIFKDYKQTISEKYESNLKENEWEIFSDLALDDQLIEASKRGYLGPVQKLVAHGAKINPEDERINNTALMEACENGHQNVVEYLLKNSATINKQNSSKIKKDMEKQH